MILLNFSHPLTDEQVAQVEALTGEAVDEVRGEMRQFKDGMPLVEQVQKLLDKVGLSAHEWQTAPILIRLPGHAPAAAVLIAEVHGRRGHFPSMLRLRPVEDRLLTRFEVVEVINLQAIRKSGRSKRMKE